MWRVQTEENQGQNITTSVSTSVFRDTNNCNSVQVLHRVTHVGLAEVHIFTTSLPICAGRRRTREISGDLSETQNNLKRHRQLIRRIIAVLRVGNTKTAEDLVTIIRLGVDLSQLAAYVRNARRMNIAIDSSFADIKFVIDGLEELPSIEQLLSTTVPSQALPSLRNLC